ncbi:MAG: peptide chain release factor 2 [Patescibacteria group bacterium]
MQDLINKIKELKKKLAKTERFLCFAKKEKEIKILEHEMIQPNFWQNQEQAKNKSKTLNNLKEELSIWKKLIQETNDLLEISCLDKEAKDISLRKEIEKKLFSLNKKFEYFEFFILFDKKYDSYNAIINIHAGAGGIDAQDWTEMLLRMYLKFCEKRKWQVKIIEESKGSEAGIKNITLEIQGNYAYGFLKSEAGIHRLVRISPFDAEKMRHTSFALVEVLPELEKLEEIEINPDDLKIDTFCSSGHGGQSVNTTYSAVRVTHLPTKISVSCQNERSQIQNKEMAMKYLQTKLYQRYLIEKQKEQQDLKGEFKPIEWGGQIRSYVLHPYQMVKDHRTDYETNDIEAILNGEIDGFIDAYLKNFKYKTQSSLPTADPL